MLLWTALAILATHPGPFAKYTAGMAQHVVERGGLSVSERSASEKGSFIETHLRMPAEL